MLTDSRPTIGVIVGSTRVGSFTRRLVDLVAARSSHRVVVIEGIDQLPFFNEGLESDPPAPVVALRNAVADVDAVLFASPEYNDGMPGMLKNGIDWLSRPFRDGVIFDKPTAALGASPTPGGGAGAVRDLTHVLRRSGSRPVEAVVTVPGVNGALDDGLEAAKLAEIDALLDDLVATVESRAAA